MLAEVDGVDLSCAGEVLKVGVIFAKEVDICADSTLHLVDGVVVVRRGEPWQLSMSGRLEDNINLGRARLVISVALALALTLRKDNHMMASTSFDCNASCIYMIAILQCELVWETRRL